MTDVERYFSVDAVARIADALNKKNVSGQCPLCRTGNFSIIDGFFAPRLYKDINDAGQVLGKYSVFPCIACSCNNCGYVIEFSLAALGLKDLFKKGEVNA